MTARPDRALAPLPLAVLRLLAWLLGTAAEAAGATTRASGLGGRERDCAALVAYLEASVEGVRGMRAMVRVVRNRMADPRFPKAACAVVGQDRQFQPVEERPALKCAVRAGGPLALALARLLRADTPFERMPLRQAVRLAAEPAVGGDPSGRALYFVNPRLMDPARCPWIAAPDDEAGRARVLRPPPGGRAAALEAAPEIDEISVACPNKHYLLVDLTPFGLDDENEVFLPTDEPHGQIECRIARE